jgi:polar amino acid transport system substrate-binding protein
MATRTLLLLLLCFGLFSSPAQAQCLVLNASSNAEYPPYLWRANADDSHLQGALALMLNSIGKSANIKIHSIYAVPWARVQKTVEQGQVDAFAGAFLTQQRLGYADYLQPPLVQTTSKVWVHKERSFTLNDLNDLKGRTGVSVINNSFGQAFDDFAKAELKMHQVSSVQQALKMLENKRVDYFIYEEQPGRAYIEQFQIQNLVLLPYVISSEPLYLALSKRSPCNTKALKQQLIQALQQAEQNHLAEHSLEAARVLWRQHLANKPPGYD